MDAFTLAAYRQCVGFLYSEKNKPVGDELERQPIGTCFFIASESKDKGRRSMYLVTARHVLDELREGDGQMFVRLNKTGLGAGVEYVPLPEEGWREHPNDQVDLAVLAWWPPPSLDITVAALPWRQLTIARAIAAERMKNWPPDEGEETVFMGLSLQHQGIQRNLPIVRMGHIALNTDELIALNEGTSTYRIIESQAYRGNSGAPVWVRYTGELHDMMADLRMDKREWKYQETFAFLGVFVSGFRSETEMIRQAGKTETYTNLGIGAVVPGEILMEYLTELEVDKDHAADDQRKSNATDEPLSDGA